MEERVLGLIGIDDVDKLKAAKVLLVGVGGVGGYVAEILARSMIGTLILVDGDIVEDSNRNRQIVALISSIGHYKTDIMKDRIKDINPLCEVINLNKRFNTDTQDEIFSYSFDFVVDAIDSVKDKVALIKKSKETNRYIISAMGAGNRIKTNTYKLTDIYKTKNDPLARKLRGLLRKEGVESLDVCIAEGNVDVVSKTTFSIGYNPAIMGATIAGKMIERIIS